MQSYDNFDKQYAYAAYLLFTEGLNQQIKGIDQPCKALFNYQFVSKPNDPMPLLTLRRLPLKSLMAELNWILSGSSNANDLGKYDILWRPWADDKCYIPSSYGRYMRKYPGIKYPEPNEATCGNLEVDQLANVVNRLTQDYPHRKTEILFHHPSNTEASYLPPCMRSLSFNWVYICNGHRRLYAVAHAASTDFLLGGPFNFFQYYLLSLLIMSKANTYLQFPAYTELHYTFQSDNLHYYEEHTEHLLEISHRQPSPGIMHHDQDFTFLSNPDTIKLTDTFMSNYRAIAGEPMKIPMIVKRDLTHSNLPTNIANM